MKTILFVDDDAVVVEAYRKKLLEADFHVETASDGLAALKMLHATQPDVVVLDMMMPKFSGLEVLKYIRSTPALNNVRVIVLSNMQFGGEQREAAAGEAHKTLAKSECTPTILIDAINEVLTASADKPSSESPKPPSDVERRLL
jgi:CheY-like chemotaxis protein